jgi:capsule biosynthesis phosphatase
MNTYVIDIDHTICTASWSEKLNAYDYQNASPHWDVINKIQLLYNQGHTIILFTARGMRTFSGNVKKIENFHRPILEKWLNDHNLKYHNLVFGKPWGPNVYYVDDKNLSIQEFINQK